MLHQNISDSIKTGIILLFLLSMGCNFPYDPKVQLPPQQPVSLNTKLRIINPDRQICNPSASQDTVHFKGCMLFLNLGGVISVNVPKIWEDEYTRIADQPHDRLTIVDTLNTVRWYMMRPPFLREFELQDPEWSTDPDYIAFLGDNDDNSSGYIVRVSDKKILQFNNGKLTSTSTPHMWVSPNTKKNNVFDANSSPALHQGSPSWDQNTGMIDKASIISYFGTDSVKFAFSKKSGSSVLSIYYIDYSQNQPEPVLLLRPKDKNNQHCESPLISPDGNWIVYNCKLGTLKCESYLQQLSQGSDPILIHEGMSAEPHWWKNTANSECYILYSSLAGPIESKFENLSTDGSAGKTFIRRFDATTNLVWLTLAGEEKTFIGLPFQGGLTPDGRFLVTGYQYGYIQIMQ